MIELSIDTPRATVEPAFVDVGGTVRGATNAAGIRIDRPGGHYRAAVTIGLGNGVNRQALIADLIRGKQEGLRMPWPLQGVDQSGSGSPVMNGADQAGRIINLRGVTPGWLAAKGFWLSIEDADGQHYLHNIHGPGIATGAGEMAIALTEAVRVPFPDGAPVHFTQPMIEGDIAGNEQSWQLTRANRVVGIQFTIEEMA